MKTVMETGLERFSLSSLVSPGLRLALEGLIHRMEATLQPTMPTSALAISLLSVMLARSPEEQQPDTGTEKIETKPLALPLRLAGRIVSGILGLIFLISAIMNLGYKIPPGFAHARGLRSSFFLWPRNIQLARCSPQMRNCRLATTAIVFMSVFGI